MDMASMRPPEPKKVCVIGAGVSGLAAARELRREGLAVTVLEQCGDIGGQWLYDPRTDADDPLGAAVPVNVHSSMYASVRLISTRETMGFSDFQFVPRPGAAGRDARRFPGRREMYCYLKDFCAAFGLADAVRLNTRVVRVAMAAPAPREASGGDVKWLVRSVHVQPDGSEHGVAAEEVFDAVVVANGHYSQPRLPKIQGMGEWSRRQLHSHSYRVPDPYRDEVRRKNPQQKPFIIYALLAAKPDNSLRLRRRSADGGDRRLRGQRPGHRPGSLRCRQGGSPLSQDRGGRHDAGGVQYPRQPLRHAPAPAGAPPVRGRAGGVRRRLVRRRRHRHLLHRVPVLVPVPRHGRGGHRGRQPRGPPVRAHLPAGAGAVAVVRGNTDEGVRAVVPGGAGQMDRAGSVRHGGAAAGARHAAGGAGGLPRQGDGRLPGEVLARHRQFQNQ
ncbi:hypothetical protein SEVIR_2G073000v4 [Setaria viridis]